MKQLALPSIRQAITLTQAQAARKQASKQRWLGWALGISFLAVGPSPSGPPAHRSGRRGGVR
jgi:hypothetical protein